MRFKRDPHVVTPALIAGVAFPSLSLNPGVAWAEEASRHRNPENTFTKWASSPPQPQAF